MFRLFSSDDFNLFLVFLQKGCYNVSTMKQDRVFTIKTEEEVDGRWIAEVVELPGVMTYGETREQAQARAEALAFRVLAEEIEENKDSKPDNFSKVAFSLS